MAHSRHPTQRPARRTARRRAALLLLLLSGSMPTWAGSELEAFEQDQRAAAVGFALGAASPVLIVGGLVLFTDASGGTTPAGTGLAVTGALGSAVGLPLLGRRSMLAAKELGQSGPLGATALFFGIGSVLTGGYAVASGGNPSAGIGYLGCSAGALLTGGLQLRQNRFIATMRQDPRQGSLLLLPTPHGLQLSGSF